MIRFREVTQRDPDAPGEIKETKEMINTIIKEIDYIEYEEGRIKEKLSSFHTIKHWTIPEFIDKEGHVKSLEEWKLQYKDMVSPTISHLKEDKDFSVKSFNMFLDRVVVLENRFSKFVVEVRAITSKKWKDHLLSMPDVLHYQWPTHVQISEWVEEYLRPAMISSQKKKQVLEGKEQIGKKSHDESNPGVISSLFQA